VEDFHNLGAQVGRSLVPSMGLVVLHRSGEPNPVVFAMSTTCMFPVIFLITVAVFLAVRKAISQRVQTSRQRIWAGGLSKLPPELTYTATGFSNRVRATFNAILRSRAAEDRSEFIAGYLRTRITRMLEEVHVLDRIVLQPITRRAPEIQKFAGMHHGRLNAYSAYILDTLLIVLFLAQTPPTLRMGLSPTLIAILVLLVENDLKTMLAESSIENWALSYPSLAPATCF